MSEDDDLAITDHLHHPHFPRPTFSASNSSRDSATPTRQPKFKKHGVVSPVSNHGVGDLLHNLNTSFAPPSSSRTSSPDEPALPPVGSPKRPPALDYHSTLSATKTPPTPPAIASTSSNDLRDSQSPTPTRRYPRQSLISSRKSNAADSIGRIYLRRRAPIPGEFYHPNLDELEAWTGAVVSPGVFGKPVFEKHPYEDAARAATRVNLAPLRRSIDGSSKSDVGGLTVSSSATGRPSAVAKAEMTRSARVNLILDDIFTPDHSIDGEISSNIPSRSSPGINTPPSDFPPVNGKHTQPPPSASTSRAPPFSGTYDISTRPKNRLPLQDLPIPPSQKIPLLHFNGTQISKALAKEKEKARQVTADRMEDMHFTLDPKSALHAQPALPGGRDEEAVESSEPEGDDVGIWQFLEPPAMADYHASTSFVASPHPEHELSHPLLHSPLPTPLRIPSPIPFQYAIPEIDPPAPPPLPTLPPEINVINSQSAMVIDTPPLDDSRSSPKPSAEAPPEDLIEIFSPMVLEERSALASHPPHPFQLLFDPILSSSLASASGEHFVATSPALAPPLAHTQETHDAREVRDGQGFQVREVNMATEERIAYISAVAVALPNENEYFDFDPPMDLQSEQGSSSAPGPRMGVESSAPPLSEAEGPPPSAHDAELSSSLEPTNAEAIASSDVPMAQATWVDMDAIPSEDTSSASSNFIPQRPSRPIVLEPGYLNPRYRNFWAPEGENPYLKRAKMEMVVGKVQEGLMVWYQEETGEEGKNEQGGREEGEADKEEGEEEVEYDELENDVESEDEDEGMAVEMEMEDPDSGMVFLSQTPTKARGGRKLGPKSRSRKPWSRRKNSSRAAPPLPDDPTMESISVGARERPRPGRPRGRGRGRGRGRYMPYDSSRRGERKKEKERGEENEDEDDLVDRVERWGALLASFIKGKKTLGHQDLLDLKQALQDIRSSAASIPSDSSLVAQVSAVANMESDDVPMGDQLGLRALAKRLVRTWA